MPALDVWLWAAGIVCVFGSPFAVVAALFWQYVREERAAADWAGREIRPLPGDHGHGPWTTETPIHDELQVEYLRRAIDKHERGA